MVRKIEYLFYGIMTVTNSKSLNTVCRQIIQASKQAHQLLFSFRLILDAQILCIESDYDCNTLFLNDVQ